MSRGVRGQQPRGGRGNGGFRGRGRGRGRGGLSTRNNDAEIEHEVQIITQSLGLSNVNDSPARGGRFRGGRGRPPRFNEFGHVFSPRGKASKLGRGIGFSSSKRGARYDAPPSRGKGPKDRPFLKPISFVRSSAVLFQDENEIFKPEIVDVELDDTPTADQVELAFALVHDDDPLSSDVLPNGENSEESDASHAPRFQDHSYSFVPSDNLPILSWPFTEAELLASTTPQRQVPRTPSPRIGAEEIEDSLSSKDVPSHSLSNTVSPEKAAVPEDVASRGSALSATDRLDLNSPQEVLLASSIIESIEEPVTGETTVMEVEALEIIHSALEPAVSVPIDAPRDATPQIESSLSFIIDTEGAPEAEVVVNKRGVRYHKVFSEGNVLGANPVKLEPEEDDEVVVFVPPASVSESGSRPVSRTHPTLVASIQPTISFSEFNFSNQGKIRQFSKSERSPLTLPQKDRKAAKREKKARRRRRKRGELIDVLLPDPPGGIPREGDSDLDWGSDGPPGVTAESENEEDETSIAGPSNPGFQSSPSKHSSHAQRNGHLIHHGMDIDPELELEDAAYEQMMARILKGPDTVTMDDLEDARRMREEDEVDDDDERGSSGDSDLEVGSVEEDAVVNAEESILVGEDTEDEPFVEDDDTSSEEEGGSFSVRLARARKLANRTPVGRPNHDEDSSSDDDELFNGKFKWDVEEDFIANIEGVLDENGAILDGRSRKQRKQIFRAIENGEFGSDIDEILSRNLDTAMGRRKKKKDGAYVAVELRDQWERDRAKKADYKKARAEARLLAQQDPFPARNSGKKKDKFGNRLYDDNGIRPPGEIKPIVDLVSLVEQIRVFIFDLGGRQTMQLPPMEKNSRKRVHDLANCFNLKSKSIGKGSARYTTLIKTTRSGVGINERRVNAILKGKGKDSFALADDRRAGDPSKPRLGRHRDGDVVGSKAEKINDSNVGFKLLQRMGWNEGERIGVTGGLADPLKAVIKNTKLGLGAAK